MTDTSSEAETSFQQAVEAFNSSNLDLAIDLLNTMVSLSPDHADAYDYLGKFILGKKNIKTRLILSIKP